MIFEQRQQQARVDRVLRADMRDHLGARQYTCAFKKIAVAAKVTTTLIGEVLSIEADGGWREYHFAVGQQEF